LKRLKENILNIEFIKLSICVGINEKLN